MIWVCWMPGEDLVAWEHADIGAFLDRINKAALLILCFGDQGAVGLKTQKTNIWLSKGNAGER